jgi:DNA-binding protein H-NS
MVDVSKLSLAEINALAAKLSKRKERLEKGQIEKVRAKVMAILKKEGLSLQDLVKAGPSGPGPRAAKKGKAKAKGGSTGRKIAPKYRNPNNHAEVWTGRGVSPKWVRELMAQGMTKEQMLIPPGG